MDPRELAGLMARYQAGDAEAFDALFAAIQEKVFAFLLARTRNREAADDVFQEVFMKIHRHRHTYLPGSPVEPWVMAIARHAAVDRERRLVKSEEFNEATAGAPDPVPESLPDHLSRALGTLPPSQRQAMVLTKVEEMTSGEAGRAMGVSEGAVKSLVHRATANLRRILGEEEP